MIKKLNHEYFNKNIEDIKELLLQSYKINFEYSLEEYDKMVNRDIENIKTYLSDKKAEIYISKDDDKVISILWFFFHFVNQKKYIHLNKIIVHEQYRGKSIATKLLDFLFDYANKHNVEKIDLNVSKKNKLALKIYENVGFKKERYYMTYTLKEKSLNNEK